MVSDVQTPLRQSTRDLAVVLLDVQAYGNPIYYRPLRSASFAYLPRQRGFKLLLLLELTESRPQAASLRVHWRCTDRCNSLVIRASFHQASDQPNLCRG